MGVVRKVMMLIQQNKVTDALWLVNHEQVALHDEKRSVEQALQVLEHENLESISAKNKKEWHSIGEAAVELRVAKSTIRHWEKEGLIEPYRELESGYRKYSRTDLHRLFVIRALRNSVYSLEIVRDILEEIDHNNMTHARKIANDSLVHIDHLIMEQLRGAYYLYKLCEKTKA